MTPDTAPSQLAYSVNPAVYTKGTAIADDTPNSSGGAVLSYAISPDLPQGLHFDTTTGTISGTPTTITAQTVCKITASTSGAAPS